MRPPEIEVFYDGACPVCDWEMRSLARRDRARRVCFTDIAAPAFSPEAAGIEGAALDQRIHARLATGEIIEGVEVFRRLYAAVGLGALVALTRLPGISRTLDIAYACFARHRKRLASLRASPLRRLHPRTAAAAASSLRPR